MKFSYKILSAFTAVLVLYGCRSAKLSVADEQFARGEYYNASINIQKRFTTNYGPRKNVLKEVSLLTEWETVTD